MALLAVSVALLLYPSCARCSRDPLARTRRDVARTRVLLFRRARVIAPFALNFSGAEGGMAAFYVVMGVAVLAVSLITNYQYSPKRDWTAEHATA